MATQDPNDLEIQGEDDIPRTRPTPPPAPPGAPATPPAPAAPPGGFEDTDGSVGTGNDGGNGGGGGGGGGTTEEAPTPEQGPGFGMTVLPASPLEVLEAAVPDGEDGFLPNDDLLASQEVRNLYDFGPFGEFADKLSDLMTRIDGNKETNPAVVNLYLSKARETLNDIVTVTPSMEDCTRESLELRMDAIAKFGAKMNNFHGHLVSNLDPEQQLSMQKYQEALSGLVDAERRKLQAMGQNMVPIGLASLLFSKGKSFFIGDTKDLAARLHSSRERDVTDRLNKMQDLVVELRKGVGNREWEATRGVKLVAEAQHQFERTRKQVEAVASQTDDKGFIKRFSAITRNFDDLQDKGVDMSFKQSLRSLIGRMDGFVNSVLTKLGFRPPAGPRGTAGPGGPT